MITVFRGLLLPRFYWGSSWSGRSGRWILEPVKTLFRLSRINLCLVSYRLDFLGYRKKALGYLRRFVLIKDLNLDDAFIMKICYSKQDGSYIGLPENVFFYLKRGITEFYRAKKKSGVASVGYSPEQEKWYGWSHRAIYGFELGHIVKDGDSTRSSGWIEGCAEYEEDEKTKPPIGFVAQTLEDCKYLAIRFAESVS